MRILYRMTDTMLEEVIAINEVNTQISSSERLRGVTEQNVQSEVRKLAIGLMFPLLKKFNMPIKLV